MEALLREFLEPAVGQVLCARDPAPFRTLVRQLRDPDVPSDPCLSAQCVCPQSPPPALVLFLPQGLHMSRCAAFCMRQAQLARQSQAAEAEQTRSEKAEGH